MTSTAISQEALRALNLYGKTIAAGSGDADNPERYAQGVRNRARNDGTLDRLTAAIRKGATAEEAVQTVLDAPVAASGPTGGTAAPTPEEIAMAAQKWSERIAATETLLAEMRAADPIDDPKAAIESARAVLKGSHSAVVAGSEAVGA